MKDVRLGPVFAVVAVALAACGNPRGSIDTAAASSVKKAQASVNVATAEMKKAPLPRPGRGLPSDQTKEKVFPVYLTAYSFWDNTPAQSTAISKPVIHQQAGGSGSYNDPITIAVGHVISGGIQTLDYPAGTRFYLAKLRKYAIVEDVCGDGTQPQYEACHIGYHGLPWLDIYIDGQRAGQSAADACANALTSVQPIVIRPRENYPVTIGPLTESGCRMYGQSGAPLSRVLASAN